MGMQAGKDGSTQPLEGGMVLELGGPAMKTAKRSAHQGGGVKTVVNAAMLGVVLRRVAGVVCSCCWDYLPPGGLPTCGISKPSVAGVAATAPPTANTQEPTVGSACAGNDPPGRRPP